MLIPIANTASRMGDIIDLSQIMVGCLIVWVNAMRPLYSPEMGHLIVCKALVHVTLTESVKSQMISKSRRNISIGVPWIEVTNSKCIGVQVNQLI